VHARVCSPSVLFLVNSTQNGVAVGVIEDHLVPVASAGCVWKFSSLVRVDCVAGVVRLDIDVLVCEGGDSERGHDWFGARRCFGGAYTLALAAHVSLLHFF